MTGTSIITATTTTTTAT